MGDWLFNSAWDALTLGINAVPLHWWLAILGGLAVLLWIVGGVRALIAFGAALAFFLGYKTGKGEVTVEPPKPVEPEKPKRKTVMLPWFRR